MDKQKKIFNAAYFISHFSEVPVKKMDLIDCGDNELDFVLWVGQIQEKFP